MKKLASQGYWVNGTSDGLGEEELIRFKTSKLLTFMTPEISSSWGVCTHANGDTNLGDVVPAYEMEVVETREGFNAKVQNTDVFFWTSFRQFKTYLDKYPEIRNKTHCCGMGKTYQQAKKHGYNLTPFAGMKEFKEWIKG
jgi:hydroxymethylbilane synthase